MNKELKRLSRRELVDVIYQLKKNEQEMQEEIAALKKDVQDKRIRIAEAGSIAEATLSITDIFSAAQKTADIYLQEITVMKEDTERICEKKIEEADNKVRRIILDGQKKLADIKEDYQMEQEKWKLLRAEIEMLEKLKRDKISEGMRDE